LGGGGTEREIARILTEVDVYRKYGLHAKALEHLHHAFQLAPDHVEAREKLSQLYAQLGRRDDAVAELWTLYQQVGPPAHGERLLQQILEIRPGDRHALALLAELASRTPAATTQPPVASRSVSEAPRGHGPLVAEEPIVDLGDEV